MNEVLRQLHERKSVRVYEERPIEPEVKRAILEAALQAPTAGNMALYTILDITDPEKKGLLAKSCDNQPFITKAPMVLRRLPPVVRCILPICGCGTEAGYG